MNLVFLDSYALNPGDLAWTPLEGYGPLTHYPRTKPEDVVQRAAEADILITNKVRLTEEVLTQLPKLRLICEAATGYDNIDVAAARRLGIAVTNVPAYSTLAVAQHTLALLFETTNHVGHYAEINAKGAWSNQPDFAYWEPERPLVEVSSLRIAVVGYGHIGEKVAEVLLALGAEVYVVTSRPATDLPEGARKATMEEAFAECDVVSLHCPLRDSNRGFVNEALLAKARRGLRIINTARGGLIDDAAVARALHEGRLAAYCTDVMQPEPPAADNPLLTAPNAYITQHIAWASSAARQRILDIMHQNIDAFLAGESLNRV